MSAACRVALAVSLSAAFGATPAAAQVIADGNDITAPSREAFTPNALAVEVGQVVRWRNVDVIAPHNATEIHGLWEVLGTRFGPPLVGPGFAPGETAGRAMEAGTHSYICTIHPRMRATISVRPQLGLRRLPAARPGAARKRVITVRWASAAPGAGRSFDAQRRRNGGAWVTFTQDSREPSGSFSAGKKRKGRTTRWEVRVRLRATGDETRATDWSPTATFGS